MIENFFDGHAVIIGIGADLPATVQDAIAIYQLLTDSNRAGYPQDQVELLTESSADRDGVLNSFDCLISQTKNNPNATVIVYFSGHGGRIQRAGQSSEYFLVPFGYDPNRRHDTAISGAEFTNKVESINARKLIVILDCCHAGGIPVVKDIDEKFVKSPIPSDLLDVLSKGSGRIILASSHENEVSYASSPYSIFTHCLLDALSGKAAVNKDGYARILDILIYLYHHVPKRTNDQQHPFVKKILDLGDNFPVCYYAGGVKSVREDITNSVIISSAPSLTSGQRRRLQQWLNSLENPRNLLFEKIDRMRSALAIETNELVKFQLEKQLLNEEVKLAQLENEINEIERSLL